MKKNAFTLIELLAVIVILSIIALIATPIILGIIKDTKEQANQRSAKNYIDAVEQAIVRKNLEGEYNPDECIINNGEVTCKGKFNPTHCEIKDGELNCEGVPLEVEIDGEVPEDGIIVLDKGKVTTNTLINFNGYSATINEKGKVVLEKINHLAKENVKASDEITKTTGIVPVVENRNITPGSEFKIKVNDTSDYLTFFVLSDEGNYVSLIAEQNITSAGEFTSEPQDNDEWYVSSNSYRMNIYGPQTAYTYLSTATSNWTNIPIIKSLNYLDEGYKGNYNNGYKGITTTLNKQTGKYITTITPRSSNYGNPVTYENMRARLPYVSEITENTTCTTDNYWSCPLWMVNYLYGSYYSTNDKVSSTGENWGYWTLSSHSSDSEEAFIVSRFGFVPDGDVYDTSIGIRPVITVLKSDLLRVMQ